MNMFQQALEEARRGVGARVGAMTGAGAAPVGATVGRMAGERPPGGALGQFTGQAAADSERLAIANALAGLYEMQEYPGGVGPGGGTMAGYEATLPPYQASVEYATPPAEDPLRRRMSRDGWAPPPELLEALFRDARY